MNEEFRSPPKKKQTTSQPALEQYKPSKQWIAGCSTVVNSINQILRQSLGSSWSVLPQGSYVQGLQLLGSDLDLVLLDGSHDWLTSDSLFDDPTGYRAPPVRTQVKGDLTCTSVAAASVLAKVDRDAQMTALDQRFPAYGWSGNKGYGAPGHQQAMREHGVTEFHRVSWNIQ